MIDFQYNNFQYLNTNLYISTVVIVAIDKSLSVLNPSVSGSSPLQELLAHESVHIKNMWEPPKIIQRKIRQLKIKKKIDINRPNNNGIN